MSLDYTTLELLRQNHPAWRLLNSPHAPLIASFLQRVYIAENIRMMAEAELAEKLEDELTAASDFCQVKCCLFAKMYREQAIAHPPKML